MEAKKIPFGLPKFIPEKTREYAIKRAIVRHNILWEEVKTIAIEILENPKSSPSEIANASIFARLYKELDEIYPKWYKDEPAIGVDHNNRRIF